MKTKGFDEILGARISGVVLKDNPGPPHQQVFLAFSDGTYFEIYGGEGEPLKGAKGRDEGGLDRIQAIGQKGASVAVLEDTQPAEEGAAGPARQDSEPRPWPAFGHPEVLQLVRERFGRQPDSSPLVVAFCVFCLTFLVPRFGLLFASSAYPYEIPFTAGTTYALGAIGIASAAVAAWWNLHRNGKWVEEYAKAEAELGVRND